MDKHLYRFRTPKALLEFQELENQEIYFASNAELNDPMEGFRDVFWRGDKIVWMNLYRHYLQCLSIAYSQWLILGESKALEWAHIPLTNPYPPDEDKAPIIKINKEIEDKFFSWPGAEAYFEHLKNRAHPVRRDELRFHLQSIHKLALNIIAEQFSANGLGPTITLCDKQKQTLEICFNQITQLMSVADLFLREDAHKNEKLSSTFASCGHLHMQLDIINKHLQTPPHNNNFVTSRFPEEYANQIDSIVRPEQLPHAAARAT